MVEHHEDMCIAEKSRITLLGRSTPALRKSLECPPPPGAGPKEWGEATGQAEVSFFGGFLVVLILYSLLPLIFSFSVFYIFNNYFFIYHLAKTKNFSLLFENLNKTKYLTIGFSLIILSLCFSNLLNHEYLVDNSWHKTFMFVIRYGLIFIILAYFYKLDFFTKKEIIKACVFSFLFLLSTGLYQVIIDPNVIKGAVFQIMFPAVSQLCFHFCKQVSRV